MIYLITNTITQGTYVGYTSLTLEERFKKHRYNHVAGNTHLYKAMRKYGFDNFVIEVLQENGNLQEDETIWIYKLCPNYNMTKGGDGGNTSDSPNWQMAMKKRRSYKGEGNPQYGKFGANNPKSKKVKVDGIVYNSITEARKLSKKSFKYVKQKGEFI
jgi:group I intron endonuclease